MDSITRAANPKELVSNIRQTYNKNITKCKKFRRQQLKNLSKFFQITENELVQAIVNDTRKNSEEARLEVIVAYNHINYLIRKLDQFSKDEPVSKRTVDLLDGLSVFKEPYGVVLIMAAWNVPILTLLPMAGAMAAGNCIIMKPSHNSPSLAEFLQSTLHKYINPQCYQLYNGNIEETKLLLEEKFDYIYYTGSTMIGHQIHLAANKNLTPTTLELGGKNPVYIDDSCLNQIEMVTKRIIWGKFMSSGQICVAPDYILLSPKLKKLFIQEAVKVIKKFFGSDYLPIINDFHYKRLTNLMRDLKTVVHGGNTEPLENSIEPTIVCDVSDEHPIMHEEVFGPILCVNTVTNVQEALEIINKKPKALVIYVFTKQKFVKNLFKTQTSSGSLVFNDTLMHIITEDLPFGGVGDSGMGLYKGKYSFDSFCHKKSILDKSTLGFMETINDYVRYPPYSKKKSDFIATILKSRRGIPLKYFEFLVIFGIGFLFCYFLVLLNVF